MKSEEALQLKGCKFTIGVVKNSHNDMSMPTLGRVDEQVSFLVAH